MTDNVQSIVMWRHQSHNYLPGI